MRKLVELEFLLHNARCVEIQIFSFDVDSDNFDEDTSFHLKQMFT